MKAPIRRVFVLPPAVWTEGEGRHAGVGAVVGDGADDAQARPAMGAVGEGVAITPVRRVGDLGGAGGAGGGVRHHPGSDGAGGTGQDVEAGPGQGLGQGSPFHGIDAGQNGTLFYQPAAKGVQVLLVRLDADQHPLAVIAHVPRQAQVPRQPPDGRPEADTLHQAAHADALGHQALTVIGHTESSRDEGAGVLPSCSRRDDHTRGMPCQSSLPLRIPPKGPDSNISP